MTRPTTRLRALLLTGFFLVQGIGVSPSPQVVEGEGGVPVAATVAAAPGSAGVDSNRDLRTAVETPGEPDAGEVPAGCADGELPCIPQDGPPSCTVVSACAAPAFLPADLGVASDASPNDRGLVHASLREPGSVFLERHTPPPRA